MNLDQLAFDLAEILDCLLWDIDGKVDAGERDHVWQTIDEAKKTLVAYRKFEKETAKSWRKE